MSAHEETAARCISVEQVPTSLKNELKHVIAQHLQLPEGNIPVEEVAGYHVESGLSRFVFLLGSRDSADKLCEEIQQEVLEKDGKTYDLMYERSTECEIPDHWTKIEASAIPGGPAVPPRAPQATQHHQVPPGMATIYQNVKKSPEQQPRQYPGTGPFQYPGPVQYPAPVPGQYPGQIPGQYSGPIPGQYLGQHPTSVPSSVPGQNPGPLPADMQQGMPHQFMPVFAQGQQQMQGPGPHPSHGQDQQRGPYQMPFMPGMPFPFMFPPQAMPVHAKEDGKEYQGQGRESNQPNYPNMGMPWLPFDPQMFPAMYPQPQQPDTEQPHSGPPPPYNGSIPDQTDHTHESETTEKRLVGEPQLSELKEPIDEPKKTEPVISKAVGDQEEYMEKLKRKIQEEQSGKDNKLVDVTDLSNDDLREELIRQGENIGPVVDSTRKFYENKLKMLRKVDEAQSLRTVSSESGDETRKSSDQSSSFEVIHDDERVNKILVTGLPENIAEEFVVLKFEKLGGTVKSCDVNREDNSAVIDFEDNEAVEVILSKRPIEISKVIVDVVKYEPLPVEELPQCTVRVSGIPESINEEFLLLYFEHPKKSGGDSLAAFEYTDGADVALLTYETEEVAHNVVERVHTLAGSQLEVCLYSPGRPNSPVSEYRAQDRGSSRQHSMNDEQQTKIIVRNLPHNANEEYVTMFFENTRKQGGGSVVNVDLFEDGTVAVVEFEEAEAVDIVLGKLPIAMSGQTLEIELYIPTPEEHVPLCTIEVRGPSDVINSEMLEMYFENEKRSEGGEITEVDKRGDVTLITFVSEEVAKRVAVKDEHTIGGVTVQVSLYEPLQSSSKFEPQPEEEEEPLCSIKVTGISKVGSMETMQYYFENAKRSGGGSVINMDTHEEEDYAYVTFSGEDVAKRVASRPHTLCNNTLNVSLYRPPRRRPAYTNRLIIKGVNPATTKDCLFNFLEAKSGASPNQLVYGEQDGTVMVSFDSEPDFDKLVKVCEKRPLEGHSLTITKVCTSNCIIVSNLKSTTTSDTVQYYFENKKRSNGGEIEKVKMLEECTCLVFFQDYTVVDEVLKKTHKLEGEELTVQVYIEDLGRSQGDGTEPRVNIPDNISIDNINEKIVNFMKKNDSCIEAVNKQLEGCYARVVWPEMGPRIVIECEITVKTPDYRKVVKDWKSNVERNLMDYVKQLSCKEHPVWDEGWDAVLGGLGEINIENPDAVALFVDKKEKMIKVVGYKHTVESVSKMIEKVIKSVSDEIERKRQTVKHTRSNLKPLQLRLLLASKFPVEMEKKFPNLKVRINLNKNEVAYEGIQQDIQSATVNMYEQISSFSTRVIDNISQNVVDLFQSKSVKDYIIKKLKTHKLVGVWEAMDLKLIVCCHETHLSSCVEFVSESVQEKSIPVHKESSSVLTSQQWQDRLNEIHSTNAGLCKICCKSDFSQVYITATDDLIDEVHGIVARFLKQHTVLQETFSFGNKSIEKLIQSHHMDKISGIAKDLGSHYVQIHCNSKGISVQGTEEGIHLAKGRLSELGKKIEKKEHAIKRPGLASHIKTDKGQETIQTVEKSYPVVIKVGSDDEEYTGIMSVTTGQFSQCPDVGVKLHATGKAYDNRKVYTAEGDMSLIRADVLVNSADSSISLSGGLGKVLATKGGNVITNECKDYVKKYGKLNEGDVFMSTGGNLQAQYIVHVSSPHWQNGQRKEDEVLKEVVFKAMQQATVKSAKSVAIPALGCGNYGFPLKIATAIITNAVKDFFREVQESTITEVYFVDVKPVTVEAFTEAIKTVFESVCPVPQQRSLGSDDGGFRSSARPVPQPRHGSIQSEESSSDESELESSTGFGNINVEVIKGEIASLQVDIIVNTTGKNLDLRNGAVSASLLRAGGATLQQDLSDNYPKGLGDEEIAVSGGGKLNCWNVFHGSLLNWDGGEKAIPALHKLIASCLQEANRRNAKAIAFPAIGTGQLGFPRDLVAKEMFSAVSKFEKKCPDSSVKDIKFVVYHKDYSTVKAFEYAKQNWSGGGRKNRRTSRGVKPKYSRKAGQDTDDGSYSAMGIVTQQKGLKRIHSTDFWLEDEHVNQAMSILNKAYPEIDGFQDVCVIETGMAKKMNDPWMQVFNRDGNHWIIATTVGCNNGVIRIYDSLYRNVSKRIVQLINQLFSRPSRLHVIIEMPRFQKQRTNHDCGLFVIAAMVDLCRGHDPSASKYDLNLMRPHLVDCLKKGYMKTFPEYRGQIERLKAVNFTCFICNVCSLVVECDSAPSVCSGCQTPL